MSRTIRLLLLLILILTGCYDRVDLNELEIVVGIGLDVTEDGKIKATVQVLNPSSLTNGNSDSEPFAQIESVAESFTEAVRYANLYSPNRLYYPHNRLIIFSEEFAKTHGTHHVIDWVMRTEEPREDLFILITSGEASDVLGTRFPTGPIPSFEITQIVLTSYVNSVSTVTTAFNYAKNLASNIPITVFGRIEKTTETNGEMITYSGGALIEKHHFLDYLTETETKGFNWLTGQYKTGLVVTRTKNTEDQFTFEIVRNNSKVSPVLKDGKLTFEVKTEVSGRIIKMKSSKSLLDPNAWPGYLQVIEEGIKSDMKAAIDKAHTTGDFLGLGDLVKRRFPNYWRDNEEAWEKIWPTASFTFDIHIAIHGVGKINRFM
ncbi:MAG: Ger(x)C family spore germination protein [Firmicutes bacterium]|nr:Ger(x)C family spore germination protein [Bacillota bacterium]